MMIVLRYENPVLDTFLTWLAHSLLCQRAQVNPFAVGSDLKSKSAGKREGYNNARTDTISRDDLIRDKRRVIGLKPFAYGPVVPQPHPTP